MKILKSREDAEDVVQDIFAHKVPALLISHPELNSEEMGRMLSVITKNLCIDRYRKRKRFPESELVLETMGGTGTDSEALEAKEPEAELEGLLAELTPRFREVLTLKYLWDLTWEEVAGRLGLSHAGARKRAGLAKKAMVKNHETKKYATGRPVDSKKGGGL